MDDWPGLSTPAESSQVAALRTRSAALVAHLDSLGTKRSSGVQQLVGLPAMVLQLRRIAPAATSSALVMQPQYAYDPEEPGLALAQAARLRGVETTLMTLPETVRTHPLLSSIYPTTLLGPVFLRALVIDGRQLLVGAPDDVDGQRTSWYTTIPAVVREVADLWSATAALCTCILQPGQEAPLTERQLRIAQLVCVGEEDTAIARKLRLTALVVQAEVDVLLGHLGVTSRPEGVLAMRGRDLTGGHRAYV